MSLQRMFAIGLCLLYFSVHVAVEDTSPINKCQIDPEAFMPPDGCEYGRDNLICRDSKSFPTAFPRGMDNANFFSPDFDSLNKDAFYGCTDLSQIAITDWQDVFFIQKGAFHSLDNIKGLHMGNKIFGSLYIEKGAFDDLSSLERLNLVTSNLHSNSSYRDDLFYSLHNLRILSINGVPGGASFGTGFEHLQNLISLQIVGGLNEIKNTTFHAFYNSTVTLLSLHADITHIESLAFAYFPHLKALVISFPTFLDIRGLSKAWYGLQYTQIKKLEINIMMYKEYYAVAPADLDDEFFSYLGMSNITTFYLKTVTNIFISADLSLCLPYVETLTIIAESHALKGIVSYLPKLSHLKDLKLGNIISYLGKIQYQEDLIAFQQDAQINSFCLGITTDQILELVLPPSLTSVVISLPKFIRFLPTLYIYNSGQLSHISISDSLVIRLSQVVFLKPPTLPMSIVLQKNNLKSFEPENFEISIKRGLQIYQLDLSHNALKPLSPFKLFVHLRHLMLEYNRIEELTPRVLNGLLNLERLMIGNNNIKEIKDCFTNMTKLTSIDLSYNSLRSVEFSVSTLKSLTKLDLQGNLIAFLGPKTMEELNILHHYSGVQVYLGGNPLICSCDTLLFIEWVLYSNVVPVVSSSFHFLKPTCLYGDTFIEIKEFLNTTLIKRFKLKCASNRYVEGGK